MERPTEKIKEKIHNYTSETRKLVSTLPYELLYLEYTSFLLFTPSTTLPFILHFLFILHTVLWISNITYHPPPPFTPLSLKPTPNCFFLYHVCIIRLYHSISKMVHMQHSYRSMQIRLMRSLFFSFFPLTRHYL